MRPDDELGRLLVARRKLRRLASPKPWARVAGHESPGSTSRLADRVGVFKASCLQSTTPYYRRRDPSGKPVLKAFTAKSSLRSVEELENKARRGAAISEER